MNTISNESITSNPNKMTLGKKVGLAAGAAAVAAFAVWSKMNPEVMHSVAENVLTFFGVDPLIDNPHIGLDSGVGSPDGSGNFIPLIDGPVVTPQDGGSVMS